jgi:phosphoglycolate phosphatase-like HAD superfamily hydrolase
MKTTQSVWNRRLTLSCHRFIFSVVAMFPFMLALTGQAADPLPSWREGVTKASIIAFVEKTSAVGSPDFVPKSERIAVFDNDGTLWCEQPMYAQAFFSFDRINQIASLHPEWKSQEPFASVLKGDHLAALTGGERGIFEMLLASHTGLTTEEFENAVAVWIAKARHPTTGRPFTEMAYQPMLELLSYLRSKEYKSFVVSGGGIEFMRVWAEKVYGIPPEQVIGSTAQLQFELVDGKPILKKVPKVEFVNDNDGKPIGIQRHIGRRPIMAFGNSDGDLEMLQWTASGSGPRYVLLVHHTDSIREWAYDRKSDIGRLDKALDEATAKGWTIVNMKDDWHTIFAK